MGSDRLDEIEGRLKAATPGPWVSKPNGDIRTASPGSGNFVVAAWWDSNGNSGGGVSIDDDDAALIASVPTDIAYLLRIARAAETLATNHDDFNSRTGLPDPCDCAHCDLRRALEETP